MLIHRCRIAFFLLGAMTLAHASLLPELQAAQEPCCQNQCTVPGEDKYWSIANDLLGETHCGECCMNPSKYNLYHFFEKNLTKSQSDTPCAEFGFNKYDSTVTHGFGPISMTLDLYDQGAAITSLASPCKPVVTAADFSLESYLGKWYIHQQMETTYLPKDQNFCVEAEYSLKSKNLFGWDLDVHNIAQSADGTVHDSTNATKGLCAKVVNGTDGKLEVAPCLLPPLFSGPYWVVQTDATQGWALVVGGQPTIPTTGGLCKTGSGVNNAGLWIFTRQQTRNETQIALARHVAIENGIDVSVLNDVDQSNCTHRE